MSAALWEQSWEVFRQAGTTLGPAPGIREAWRRGRERYAVWLLRVRDEAVRARVAETRAAFAEAIVPVAEEDLHITLWVAGFPARRPVLDDDIDEAVLAHQARALRGGTAVRLTVGGVHLFQTCLVLRVEDPWGQLADLRRRLAVGPAELRFGPWMPHITVGRFPTARPTGELVAQAERWRRVPELPLRLREVERVDLDARRWDAPLRPRWRIPLRELA